MKKIKNIYILNKVEKEQSGIDSIGVWYSYEYLTPDSSNYAPAYWHIIVKYGENDAISQADGQTYQTEAEAMQAMDIFVTELFEA
jgi:hypothetical protein